MRQTTINASTTATEKSMGNGNRKSAVTSLSSDEARKHSDRFINSAEVPKWTSTDVQHWIKHQCKKFELKKATAEKFELNGKTTSITFLPSEHRWCYPYLFRPSVSLAHQTRFSTTITRRRRSALLCFATIDQYVSRCWRWTSMHCSNILSIFRPQQK